MRVTTTKLVAMALSIGLMTGCAGLQEQIDQLKVSTQQAQSDAAAAKKAADSVLATANEAKTMASNAMSAADAAKRAADQANACCQANTEKIDRMFKQGMKK